MSDQTDEALKADVDENNITESPADESNLSKTEEVVPEEATAETEVEPEAEDKRSAQHRIRELAEEKNKYKEEAEVYKETAKSLSQRLEELTGRQPNEQETQFVPPQEIEEPEPLFKPGETEVFPEELEKRIRARDEEIWRKTQAYIDLQSARERNLERINREAQDSVGKYSHLDPRSENFDKDLSDTVYTAVESYVRANPTGSVKKFVDNMMKPYLRSVEKTVGEQKEAITKQASETALRPTHIAQGEKKFEDMTLAEMEKVLGGVHK